MASAATKYKEAREKVAAARKTLEQTAKSAFTELSSEFFGENPEIVAFGWTQYTPYFNDGDPCNFSAHTDYPSVTFTAKDGKTVKYNENSGEMTDADDFELEYETYSKEASAHAKTVAKFMKNFEEDDLETMFGDGVEVVVTPKGASTEDYEHD